MANKYGKCSGKGDWCGRLRLPLEVGSHSLHMRIMRCKGQECSEDATSIKSKLRLADHLGKT